MRKKSQTGRSALSTSPMRREDQGKRVGTYGIVQGDEINMPELLVKTKLLTQAIAMNPPIQDARRPQKNAGRGVARVVLIGNHVPRQCGIATFTADLCEALGRELPPRELHRCSRERYTRRVFVSGASPL